MKVQKTLEDEVNSIIFSITGKNIDDVNVDLVGKPYYLKPRDMVYLFIEIQEMYGIKIPEEIISTKKFSTVNEISKTIKNSINDTVN